MNLKLDKSVEVKSRKFSPYFRLKTKVRLIYCCAFTWAWKSLSFAIHIYLHEPKPSLIIHKLIIHREDFSIFPNQYFEVSCDLKLVGPLQTNTSQ